MARINSNLDPKVLKRAHLIAEYREITIIPGTLKRALKTKTKEEVLKSIPKDFTLNKGHVSFFYDKQQFLIERFQRLCKEMEVRGYKTTPSRAIAFEGFDKEFYQSWQSTSNSDRLVEERIALRISQKPHLYKD